MLGGGIRWTGTWAGGGGGQEGGGVVNFTQHCAVPLERRDYSFQQKLPAF